MPGLAERVHRREYQQPCDQDPVLHRVPAPEPAPSQLDVGPVGPGGEPGREQGQTQAQPAPQRPPLPGAERGRHRDEERHDGGHLAQVQQGRVVQHRRMLQYRLKPGALDRRYRQAPEGIGRAQDGAGQHRHAQRTPQCGASCPRRRLGPHQSGHRGRDHGREHQQGSAGPTPEARQPVQPRRTRPRMIGDVRERQVERPQRLGQHGRRDGRTRGHDHRGDP